MNCGGAPLSGPMARRKSLRDLLDAAAVQALFLVPTASARRVRRDLRDAAWLRHADVAIVSFPKSGRTFVRAMLSRLFQRRFGIDERRLLEFPLLMKAAPEVPRILFTHAGDAMRLAEEIELDRRAFEHSTVILLGRHPGDVVISWYHQLRYRDRSRESRRAAQQPLDQFIWREHGGIAAIVRFMNEWAKYAAERQNAEIFRYEDFLSDPRTSLRKLTDRIGLELDQAELDDAVDFGAFDNLKVREREGYFLSARLRAAKKGVESSFKVRRGISGGYRTQLEPSEVAKIDKFVSENLDPIFGY